MRNKIITICILALAFLALKYSGLENYFSFEGIKKNITFFQERVENYYLFSVAAYILLYALLTGFSIPVAVYLTLAGGFLFGTVPAALYVNIGATAGAVIVFLSTRYLLGDQLQEKYRDRLDKFNRELEKNGPNYFLTLRFIPAFPFFLINILGGLTKIPLTTFVWTTAAGIIPGSLVYSFAGSRLKYIRSPKDILSAKVLLAFSALAVFSILPVVIKKIRKTGKG